MAAGDLWTEKYRPKSITDYVWVGEDQRSQVENWVKDGAIPNLLITGSPGTGKCLGGDERIRMLVDKTKLTSAQLAYLSDPADQVIELSMLDLFKLFQLQDCDYEVAHDIEKSGIKIESPNGWQPILALVKKHADAARYLFEDDLSLTCATKHLVFDDGVCKPIHMCDSVDTVRGQAKIIGCEFLGEMDLFDVSIPAPHVYQTINGILHHNTTLAKCLLNELKVDDADIRYVNGSHTTGIDNIRSLSNFIETIPNGDFRYVLLDECLDENTLVWVMRDGAETPVKIKDVDQDNDLVKSYNIEKSRVEWRPFVLLDKGEQDVVEIEFEDGSLVVCTPTHKWFIQDPQTDEIKVVTTDQLANYGHILTT